MKKVISLFLLAACLLLSIQTRNYAFLFFSYRIMKFSSWSNIIVIFYLWFCFFITVSYVTRYGLKCFIQVSFFFICSIRLMKMYVKTLIFLSHFEVKRNFSRIWVSCVYYVSFNVNVTIASSTLFLFDKLLSFITFC